MGAAGLTIAFLAVPAWIAAAVQVSLPAQQTTPGSSAVIPVMCTSQGGSASGIQFDLSYDSASVTVSATVGDAARNAGKSVYIADVAPGQKRFVVTGLNTGPIPDGALVNLFLNLSADAAASDYPLQVSNVVAADANGQPVAVVGANGLLEAQSASGTVSRLPAAGILNGASLLPGPVAPGEVLTLGGAGIGPAQPQQPGGAAAVTVLGGVSVLFDGTPSPLLYGAPNQINLVVPYGVFGKQSTALQVLRGDQIVAALTVPVVDASPAIFTLDASGVGSGAILNEDSTTNSPSNPAGKGSVITLFASGAGQTDPPGVDGKIAGDVLPKPLLPVSVKIGGVKAELRYVGAAPALVAGVLQINCVVPADSPSGYTVPILLTVGNAESPGGTTLAIR